MRKKLALPLFLCLIAYNSSAQFVNNFHQLMHSFKPDSLLKIPDSLKTANDKSIIRRNLMWSSQLAPHGNVDIAAQAIVDYATNFTPPSINPTIGGSPIQPWTEIGPIGHDGSKPDWNDNGQIHRIVFHPSYNINSKSIYAGSFFGGLWKSVDGGESWNVLGTDQQLPQTSVSGIAINHLDTNMIFVCTGEGDERSWLIANNSNLYGRNPIFTTGIFRSEDNGNSWSAINNGFLNNFVTGGVCRDIAIHPRDENKLFVVTSKGLFRTTNATAASPTWNKITVKQGAVGLEDDFKGIEFHPDNPDTMYVSSNDIYKSTDGGSTWQSMTDVMGPTSLTMTSIAPNYLVDRINLAVTPAAPDRLYAYITGADTATKDRAAYIYMYKNNNWQFLKSEVQKGTTQFPVGWMGFAVSPADPDVVYFGGTKVLGSNNINILDSLVVRSPYSRFGFHADVHELIFEPNTIAPLLFCGNHGGISVKDLTYLNIYGWEYRNNGLNTNLNWSFDVSKVNNIQIRLGTQDNGIRQKLNVNNQYQWADLIGGDGYAAQIVNDMNGSSNYPRTAYKTNGSAHAPSKPWNAAPYASSAPNYLGDPDSLEVIPMQFQVVDHPITNKHIYGLSDLYSSILPNDDMPYISTSMQFQVESDLYATPTQIDSTTTEFPSLSNSRQVTEFDISKSNPDYVYVASKAPYGRHTWLYRSTTGLSDGNYTDINAAPVTPRFINISDSLPLSTYYNSSSPPNISGIAISPTDHLKVWISVSGYQKGFRVFKTIDGGNTWENADPDTTLPQMPANNIVVQEGTNDRLFLATNVGVYYTEAGMPGWEKLSDFPNCQVMELRINTCSNKLFAATYGRGAWSIELPESTGYDHEREITTNTTYTEDAFLERNLRVKSGSKLTIKGILYMPSRGKIIVEAGATLEVDGGTIKNNCDTFWDGIEVWGNSGLNHSGNNQGKLILKNDAVLENANTAVSLWKTDDWNSMGGLIQAEDATFKNCRRAVQFMSYSFYNYSYFLRCKFILDDDYDPENVGGINQVTLWDVHGVLFRGCDFEDNRTTPSDFEISNGNAIFSIDAGYRIEAEYVTPSGPGPIPYYKHSTIKNFNHGIRATGAGTAHTITVDRVDFEGNMKAVEIDRLDNFRFIRNNVKVGGVLKNGYTKDNQFGLSVLTSSGFEVEANAFEGNANSLEPVGVYIENSGTESNQVYKNEFKDNAIGQWYNGLNRDQDPYEGLQFLCNTSLQGNDKEVLVDKDGNAIQHGIRDHQGSSSPSLATGNVPSTSSTVHVENKSDNVIKYYYGTGEQLAAAKLIPTAKVIQYPATNGNGCATQYRSSYAGAVPQNLSSEFYNQRAQYEALLYTYFQNIDGGNTDSLLQAINMSWNNEAQDLRDNLMNEAPYLSEEALREAAGSGILTDALLLEVCLANMDATTNEDFLNYLQYEIPNPLPESMIQLIYLNWSGVTPRTILENQLATTNASLGLASNQLLYYYMTDSLDHSDSIESLLAARKHPASNYRLVELAIAKEDYEEANNLIGMIEEGPELTEWQQAEHDNLKAYVTFRASIRMNDKAILDLGEEELTTLRTIAELKTGRSSHMAQNILCFGYGECDAGIESEGRVRSPRVYNMNPPVVNEKLGNFSLVPNPAKTSIEITWDGEQTEGSKMLRVYAINGQILLEQRVSSRKTTINVNKLENGTYLYEILEDGTTIYQGKLIIQK